MITQLLNAGALKMANKLPPGCLYWLLNDGPDPLWNNGAFAIVRKGLVRRGLMHDVASCGWTPLGRAVQVYVQRNRRRRT